MLSMEPEFPPWNQESNLSIYAQLRAGVDHQFLMRNSGVQLSGAQATTTNGTNHHPQIMFN